MKRKSRGQSLVEFAMVFPLIMVFLFGTIDFGYYIFSWASIQFASRRAAEQASTLPPRLAQQPAQYQTTAYIASDPCLRLIFNQTQRAGAINGPTTVQIQDVSLSFHLSGSDGQARNGGRPSFPMVAQVLVSKTVRPLTPLAASLFRGQPWSFVAVSRRTVILDGLPIGGTPDRFRNCQD